MAHLQPLCVRATTTLEPTINGHATLLSCPPYTHVLNAPDIPFNPAQDAPAVGLQQLLQLAGEIDLEGEITPIQALALIRADERYGYLDRNDWAKLMRELRGKTRCYG